MYCVNGNYDANPHFAFFFQIFIFPLSLLYNAYGHFFCQKFLSNHLRLFSVNDFSATTWVRVLKFGTKLDSDKLYRVRKEQPYIANQSLYCSFFFLSNGNFCHRFLSSYWSQCFQILCTSSGRKSVLCKWKLRC